MDLENYNVSHGVNGKVLSRQFEKRKEPRKRNWRMKRTAMRLREIYVARCKAKNSPDWRYVLIDYRNNNEQIKAKFMNMAEAFRLNKLLSGSGFAWARCAASQLSK